LKASEQFSPIDYWHIVYQFNDFLVPVWFTVFLTNRICCIIYICSRNCKKGRQNIFKIILRQKYIYIYIIWL
jgi:hypothetical protein